MGFPIGDIIPEIEFDDTDENGSFHALSQKWVEMCFAMAKKQKYRKHEKFSALMANIRIALCVGWHID